MNNEQQRIRNAQGRVLHHDVNNRRHVGAQPPGTELVQVRTLRIGEQIDLGRSSDGWAIGVVIGSSRKGYVKYRGPSGYEGSISYPQGYIWRYRSPAATTKGVS